MHACSVAALLTAADKVPVCRTTPVGCAALVRWPGAWWYQLLSAQLVAAAAAGTEAQGTRVVAFLDGGTVSSGTSGRMWEAQV